MVPCDPRHEGCPLHSSSQAADVLVEQNRDLPALPCDRKSGGDRRMEVGAEAVVGAGVHYFSN